MYINQTFHSRLENFNNATFSTDYKSQDWLTVVQIDKGNPNLSFHNYIEEVEKMLSNHAPLGKTRKAQVLKQTLDHLWFTKVYSD